MWNARVDHSNMPGQPPRTFSSGPVHISTLDQILPLTMFSLQSDAPVPLIPPPPAPLNIPPSRARRQLAARLALHKQQAEEATAAAEEAAAARNSDDPFASLGDREVEGEASDPFTLDEEEEDITSSGRRDKKPQAPSEARQGFSVSRGLTSLFSSTSRNRGGGVGDEDEEIRMPLSPPEDDEDDEDGSSGSSSGEQHHPVEAAPTQERIPLETDEDEDEMGEMVAPSEDADEDAEEEEEDEEQSNSSDDQIEGEMLSPVEKEKLRESFGSKVSADASRPAGLEGRSEDRIRERNEDEDEAEEDEDEDEEEEEEGEGEGEGLVEIAMPSSGGRRRT